MIFENILVSNRCQGTLLALPYASHLKHSSKDTANPICNQLLISSSKDSSTQALAPEKVIISVAR